MDDDENKSVDPSTKLLNTWQHLFPPIKEADILQKWYVAYGQQKE